MNDAVALGAVFSNRLLELVLDRNAISISVTHDVFVATRVDMVHNQITT